MHTLLNIFLSVVVSASIDSTILPIGDQTVLHLEAGSSAGEKVVLPLMDGNRVIDGIEVVERGAIDTTEQDGRKVLRQDVVITSFQDSLYYVDGMPFLVDGDTLMSNGFSLNVVQPFVLDTTNAITDIKPVQQPPIYWWGYLKWVVLACLIIGLAVLGYYLWRYYLKKKKGEAAPIDPELLRPCDEVALEKLDLIKEEKAWLAGEHKKYFSELTFVVREYIGRRYDVHSNEKTSDDTLQAMKPLLQAADQRELYHSLEKMLRLADLVKFAKWHPTDDENEVALRAAYEFVKETKPTEEEKGKQGETQDADYKTVE